MAISRWSPVSDLVALHNTMDRLFGDSFAGRGRGLRQDDIFGVIGEGFLPLDVYQTEKEWVIRAGVPNVDPEQVEVTCDGNTIRISGEIKAPEDNESQNYVMRENFYGAFSREQLATKLDMPVNLLRASLRRSLAEVELCLGT